MVLSFALCATFAFAQTNNSAKRTSVVTNQAPTKIEATATQAGYHGSIFTKAAGDVIFTETFTTAPTTGTLTANDQVNGTAVGANGAHTQTAYSSTWRRLTDTTATYLAGQTSNFPVFAGYFWQGENFPLRSNTPTDGWMLMSMLEFIPSWGGHGNVGGFNAYFQLDNINTTGRPIVDIRFYQFYRKFNYDQAWIDYSTDGTTWNAIEINVKNVDVAVNGNLRGFKRVTMPTAIADQNNVSIRFRYSCESDKQNGAYGYFWAIDDVVIEEGATDRMTAISNEYFEGFYQLLPQGLNLPMVWNAKFQNTGANAQQNVTGSIYTMADLNTAAVEAASVNLGTVASQETKDALIDPFGWYAMNGFGYVTDDPTANPHVGPTAFLPSNTTGQHFWYADVNSAAIDHIYAGEQTFDTVGYTVNAINPNNGNSAVWGHDNGVLTKFSYWTYGMVGENTFSSDFNDVGYDQAGYRVYNSYVTGPQVPAGWRIKGIQIVASTYPGLAEAGATISGELRADSVITDGDNHSVYFRTKETGANAYNIQPGDLNNLSNLTYQTFGNYNVITLDFPEQPALEANTAYRVGYCLEEDGYFATASNRNFYYTLSDTTATWFGEVDGMEGFATVPGHDNYYSTLVYDPYDGSFHFFNVSSYPMIRMLVGPYEYRPHTAVHFNCGNGGVIYSQSYDELCGTTDSVVTNSTHTYLFSPDDNYTVETITVNGEVVFTGDEESEGQEIAYSLLIDENETTIEVTFRELEAGIENVAGVEMNLMPNPASSNVVLNINGVAGQVDLQLIDMSGRVIRSSKINAEVANSINLNGLAKGAYFVRITNNNFSKVEKLIVR